MREQKEEEMEWTKDMLSSTYQDFHSSESSYSMCGHVCGYNSSIIEHIYMNVAHSCHFCGAPGFT